LRGTINGAGHTFGYRSFEKDATNLKLLALITFGEGLHNNHHARPPPQNFPRSAASSTQLGP
jgi:stearoyl-CoA desaturase (delta-9 desaturase)